MNAKLLQLPDIEQQVLDFWRQKAIFEKVVATRKDGESFVFYDGPPFANGMPHYGHISQMAIKDAVIRYKTMQGFNVPRKIGWDTHGLPIEYELEKELGISGKRDIETYGVEKFVEAARNVVLRYTKEWQATMERMGRWVDLEHPYTTMDPSYIESVWWAFGELHKKGLIYKDFRVSPYCPRCGTVLSNFELNLGYKDNVPDVSVSVGLAITSEGKFKGKQIVFWTTTPWTIPAVLAMAVNPEAYYAVVKEGGKEFIVAEARVHDGFPEGEVIDHLVGSGLIGLSYEALYDTGVVNANRIVVGDHVSVDDGTGIASIAPAYGDIDSQVGKREGLPLHQIINPDGTMKEGLPGAGLFVKKADRAVIQDLESRGALVKEKAIEHTYPFCWRCDTPLLYYPATSWYVKVTALQERLIEENNEIKWLPEHLRDGRFGRWLEGARDWAISRDRYWGAPLPVWECAGCNGIKILTSLSELGDAKNTELHRPAIDLITFPCGECEGTMHRVPYVFDCWFESGSMPFAQHHYPFENQEIFNPADQKGYPADFIAEALDQTRGWFYTMHVLGVGLFNKRAYENVVVSGLLLAPDGKKLSKKLRNYLAPEELFAAQGVDALRLFLFTATALGEDYRFSDVAVNDVKRRWIMPLLNVVQYYALSQNDRDDAVQTQSHHALLDTWIKARVAEARHQVFAAMEGSSNHAPFDLVRAARTFGPLVEDLSTWYIRLSRGRKDPAFTETLQAVLIKISTTYASFLPFLAEHIYQSVNDDPEQQFPESVHLCTLKPLDDWIGEAVLKEMVVVRDVVTLGRDMRAKAGIPLRQPLSRLVVQSGKDAQLSPDSLAIIGDELQIESIKTGLTDSLRVTQEINGITLGLDTTLTPELKARGLANGLRRVIQDLRKQANLQPSDPAEVTITNLPAQAKTFLEPQLGQTQLTDTSTGVQIGEATHTDDDTTFVVKLYSVPPQNI